MKIMPTLDGSVTVGIYGPKRNPARTIATQLGANQAKVCLVKPAGDATEPGFLSIVNSTFGDAKSEDFDVYADGVVLTESGSAAVLFTADCPTVILLGRFKNGQIAIVAVHAGRAAMAPVTLRDGNPSNIITWAYKKLVKGLEVEDVQAYITGAICGHCFKHDKPEARGLVEPFKQFGEHAILDDKQGTLDLVKIIKEQLLQFGLTEANIKHDGVCTLETDWLASYRRDRRKERNAIVVVLH